MEKMMRIGSIRIENFKNNIDGIIVSPSFKNKDFFSDKSDVMGIYGQNGSGKTSLVDALGVIKKLFVGRNLDKDIGKYVRIGADCFTITVEFAISVDEYKYLAEYSVSVSKDGFITSEVIKYKKLTANESTGENVQSRKATLCSIKHDETASVKKTNYHFNNVTLSQLGISGRDLIVIENVAYRMHFSYFFNKEFKNKLDISKTSDLVNILKVMYSYAMDLFIINNQHNGFINAELMVPISFRIKEKESTSFGEIPVNLLNTTTFHEEEYNKFVQIVNSINMALGNIIPEMQIEIYEHSPQLLQDNKMGKTFELLSVRDGVSMPLRYESDGIIKIISILNVLIYAYNNSTACVAIDELDSGIFEFLLGELLEIFCESGKGQIIFTSHNLRPLEILDNKCVYFSTINPQNRYINMTAIRGTNNLRDCYIRSIQLGGQKEELYKGINKATIARNFRKAGRILKDE